MKIIKKGIFQKKRLWAGVLLAQFLLFYIFSQMPAAVQRFENFFESQKKIHQSIFAEISFSAGDVFYIFSTAFFLFIIVKCFERKRRHNYLLAFIITLNISYLFYQIFWGMLYHQVPIQDSLSQKEINLKNVKLITTKYLERCKISREKVNEDDNGVFVIRDFRAIEKEILYNQTKLPTFLPKKSAPQISSFKPSLFTPIMSYTGVLGYYNPFSAEANYNPKLPHSYLPFTLAHESAHQLGYAREQEANFIGFLLGINADNTDLKYSAEYFTLKSLLIYLSEKDPEFVKNILGDFSAGMLRDRDAEMKFRRKHSGLLDIFFRFTNDWFLKSNQQEGAITYSYFIDLLLQYETK